MLLIQIDYRNVTASTSNSVLEASVDERVIGNDTVAAGMNKTLNVLNTSGPIVLAEPFFVERYSNSTVEPQNVNTTFTTTAPGSGMLNGTVKVQTEANATITYRNNETIFLQGHAKYITTEGDIASYLFLELGKINPSDMTYSGGGIGIFDKEATGKLASLSNIVSVYKSHIDANGNATVLYYKWN